jgi:hypothetical protein
MHRRKFISHALVPALAGVTVCGFSGCGALLQSERCGRPHGNDIDWKIAALDGLGLLLFFVPGVIAFAVDFYTGAIYLPIEPSYPGYGAGPQVPLGIAPHDTLPPSASNSGPAPAAQPPAGQPQRPPASQSLGLKRVVIPREQIQPQYLEQVVEKHVGRQISLDGSEVRLSELARIDQFDEQLNRHRADRNYGYSVRSFFVQLAHA